MKEKTSPGFTLSMFDVTGIQEYIFQSNRLKENIGASTLVEKALSDFLKEAIQDVLERYAVDWERQDRFAFLDDHSLESEIIYAGGGNAMVAFRDRDAARKVARQLSRILLERAPGLNITVVHQDDCGENFDRDRQSLLAAIQKKKAETYPIRKMGGLSITELCPDTYQPVTDYEHCEAISAERQTKRAAARTKTMAYSIQAERFDIPAEFDDLGREEGESYIGVVHIDGNSSGARINQLLAHIDTYDDAVRRIRQFSKEMDQTYKRAYQFIIDKLQASVIDNKIGQIKLRNKGDQEETVYLPIRDIVLNGDDVTFVCDGRLALSLSHMFLSYLNRQSLSVDGRPCTACAGIAIVKPHFPFYRAYRIAEQCCAFAKRRAKREAVSAESVESWLDFHVVTGGIREVELREVRKKHYRIVDGVADEDKYHLLWRPWRVSDASDGDLNIDPYHFAHFIRIYRSFVEGGKAWPRNKLKQLKNAFALGKQATAFHLREAESRGWVLPDFPPEVIKDGFTPFDQTPYYDVLEMLDLFTILPE